MSGGHFDYKQHHISDIAVDIEQVVLENDNKNLNKYGDTIGYGYSPEVIARFNEAITILKKAAWMTHEIDWLLSGDTGEDTFIEQWNTHVRKQDNN